jgi:hypothetical protein
VVKKNPHRFLNREINREIEPRIYTNFLGGRLSSLPSTRADTYLGCRGWMSRLESLLHKIKSLVPLRSSVRN